MTDDKSKCAVRAGNFVIPCQTLSDLIDDNALGFSRAKGIVQWNYTNMKTSQPSRSFVGAKTKAYPKGFAFNFCPVCGTDISAPFTEAPAVIAKAAQALTSYKEQHDAGDPA